MTTFDVVSTVIPLPLPECYQCERQIPAVAVVDVRERYLPEADRRVWCTVECLADTWNEEGTA